RNVTGVQTCALPISNLQAAIGAAQVKKLPRFVEKKRQIAGWYREALAPLARAGRVHLAPEAPWARNVFWMYSVVLADPHASRDRSEERRVGKRRSCQ